MLRTTIEPAMRQRREMAMLPGIVAFILRSAAMGSLLGAAVAGAFIATDTAGIGTMIGHSEAPLLPVSLLVGGFAVLFGSVYTGAAIMLLPTDANAEIWRSIRVEPMPKGE